MKKLLILFFASVFIFFASVVFAGGDEPTNKELLKEIRDLKTRILELETRLTKQEQKMEKTESQTERIQDKVEHIDTHRVHKEEAPAFTAEGFKIGAGATFVVQGTDEINADDVTGHDTVTDASYSVDLEVEKEFEDYGKAFVHLETGDGAGVEDELKVFSSVNRDADDSDSSVSVTEVWYEHYYEDLAVLTFGRLDATAYFDSNAFANDETSQFLGRIFRNSPTIEFPDNTGGIRLGLIPAEFLELDFGLFDADGDWEDILDEGFYIGQINIKPSLFDRPGNYRLLGWVSDRKHTRWDDSTQTQENTSGYGVSLDQELADNLGVFARYGWQDPKQRLNGLTNDFSLEHSWSTGLQLSGALWGRDDDIFALAVGQAIPSDDYKGAGTNLEADTEGHLEAYYNYKVNDHLTLSPDFQIIWNPYGSDADEGDDTISVYGMRAQVDF